MIGVQGGAAREMCFCRKDAPLVIYIYIFFIPNKRKDYIRRLVTHNISIPNDSLAALLMHVNVERPGV